jgi:hypothetical protein
VTTPVLDPHQDLLAYKRARLLQLRERMTAARVLEGERLAQYRKDPALWVHERLGEHFWSKQVEIAESVRDFRHTAVPSCHGAGKSFCASRVIAHWLDTHLPGEAFVVSTAPTFAQVRAILWREIGRAHRKGNLLGRINQTEWKLPTGELIGFGRKPADEDVAGFQGIHSRAVLVVLDEAGGVPEQLWIAADALITNTDSRLLAIGNPDDPTSYFAKVCGPGSGWNVIPISAFDTPNLTSEPLPRAHQETLKSLLVSEVWVEEKRHTWGEDSPLWQSKILGQFPDESLDNRVIPLSLIRRAQAERSYITDPELPDFIDPRLSPVELGVDVGAGADETVIRERRGIKLGRVWRSNSTDPMAVVGLIVQAIRETGANRVKVDTIGVGWGVAGRLEELARERTHQASVVRVNVAEASSDPVRWMRLRDELWWTFREALQEGSWDLSGIDDDTVSQLIAPLYALDSAGRTKVEPKEETKKRLGRSPDDADALLLAFLEPSRTRSRKVVAW